MSDWGQMRLVEAPGSGVEEGKMPPDSTHGFLLPGFSGADRFLHDASALTRGYNTRGHVTCYSSREAGSCQDGSSRVPTCCSQELLSWFWIVTWWVMFTCDAELRLLFTQILCSGAARRAFFFFSVNQLVELAAEKFFWGKKYVFGSCSWKTEHFLLQ